MKNVCILLPHGAASVGCIEGAAKIFNTVNDFLAEEQRSPAFSVTLVATDKNPRLYDNIFSLTADYDIHSEFPCDLIVLPAVNGNMQEVIAANTELMSWARRQHARGAELASLCVGAFLLASTGLMSGRKCSTHWMAVEEFRAMFPDVELVSEKIITDDQGLYSSGGANSFWNLLLYLVEKYESRDMAIRAAKYFEIDIGRQNQNPFIMFRGQKQHKDEPVKKAQEFIESNFRDKISVDHLSSLFALGRRSLERRFKKATCYTVAEYIQRVKVEAAKKSFETEDRNVNEIMYDVGYTDTKAFRSVFKKHTGLSPLDYRNKYRKELVS
jgi:transcriptional regulator GlxA family with amidase domain